MRSQQPTLRRASARAFTLVELLVVIAIIALVVSMVLTIIPQIQRQSKSVVCLSNQRQLNIGVE